MTIALIVISLSFKIGLVIDAPPLHCLFHKAQIVYLCMTKCEMIKPCSNQKLELITRLNTLK